MSPNDKNLGDMLSSMPKPSLSREKKRSIQQALLTFNANYERKANRVGFIKRLSIGIASISAICLLSLIIMISLNHNQLNHHNGTINDKHKENLGKMNTTTEISDSGKDTHSSGLNSGYQQFSQDENIVQISDQLRFSLKNLGGGASNFEYEIAKTTNGGASWVKQGTVRLSHIRGLSFIDENTGFLINNSPAFEVMPSLFVTHNSGKDWTEQQLPIPNQYKDFYRQAKFPIFFSESLGVIPVFGFKDSEGINYLYMLTSTDSGATWTAVLENQSNNLSWTFEKDTVTIAYQNQQVTIKGD